MLPYMCIILCEPGQAAVRHVGRQAQERPLGLDRPEGAHRQTHDSNSISVPMIVVLIIAIVMITIIAVAAAAAVVVVVVVVVVALSN